ncbi:MAG: LPS export ABC transporter periplasmic protein LptC [Flavobacteriaceae bacterium]
MTISLVAMLFSCGNNYEEVNDLLADKNLPIAVTKNISLVYTDSGYVKNKLNAALLYNFENRKNHPYQEFPKGIKITTFDKKGDSTTITSDYAITYQNTNISEIKGNVIVFNHSQILTLKTKQLFWDQSVNYFYSSKKATLYKLQDTVVGLDGFDSNADLTNASMMNNSGILHVNEN